MTQSRTVVIHSVLAAGFIALDQWIKHLVETGMGYHEQIDLLPFFALFRTHNTGIAFSLLADFGAGGLIVLSLVIAAFVLWLAWISGPGQRLAHLGFTLIIAGAIGNLIDRVLLGYVVDYFLFHTPAWSFAVFNLADVWITLGAGLVLLEEFVSWRRAEKAGSD
ncbi:signal peptidase II [Zhengella mangrovi]|uniref:Lipoprotein signal peptidase n=1 Tax=Zhengella mangrovi TaxID=1982044 RepID=A0A2G1QT67_9HYPH|nr:signal peptidase II [Zhengella mangrovi]PHP68713.1 signal peptidase II [Zhengella mangrovi]